LNVKPKENRKPTRRLVFITAALAALILLVAWSAPNSLLVSALRNKQGSRARLALSWGADPNLRLYSSLRLPAFLGFLGHRNSAPWVGNSPLELAVEEDLDFATIRTLLERGAAVNVTDGYHVSPLLKAASRGRTDVVRLLLEHGADPSLSQSHYGPRTPIIEAVEQGNLDMARILLDHGADPNARGDGKVLLMLAQTSQPMSRLLKEHGARWGGPSH
jgi:hypothetical protein